MPACTARDHVQVALAADSELVAQGGGCLDTVIHTGTLASLVVA
jgi:hypothetical protein